MKSKYLLILAFLLVQASHNEAQASFWSNFKSKMSKHYEKLKAKAKAKAEEAKRKAEEEANKTLDDADEAADKITA
jgi:hypothetical protein